MCRQRIRDWLVPIDVQNNAIRHVESCLLTGILYGYDNFTYQPLTDEFIGQCRVETDQIPGILRARKSLGRGRLDQERVGREFNRLALHFYLRTRRYSFVFAR
jgi:hypothetical protein